tara:strand:- start:1971 stop:2570 length:600 start_codon:yes stop_codon:yes gene_type:complete
MKEGKIELFSTPIHVIQYENNPILDDCRDVLLKLDYCVTRDDLHLSSPFSNLADFLLKSVSKVFDDYKLIRDSEYITCMWANVSPSYNKHPIHLHANSFWSGVLYLNCPKPDSGWIEFKDPRQALLFQYFEYEQENEFSMRSAKMEPEDNKLILFPSWLEHGTMGGNFSESKNQKRISLSFNVMPRCNVKNYSNQYNFQ